jgi:TolA-binding protein
LIDPENGLDRTEAGKLAVYLIGGNYQAMAVYQDAAEWYERFANESSSHEDAPQALSDAVVLRLGLGQSDKAIDDSRKFATLFGAKHRAKAAQIAFAIGAHYAEREEWKNAEKALSAHIAVFDSGAGLDIKLQAHAVLGRALAAQKKTNDADAQYGLVRDAWKDPATAVRSLDALGGNEQQRERRRGKTLTAVGEALYYFAAKKRAEADAIKFPDYKGKDDEAAIRDFVGTKIAEWLVKKDTAIRAAQEEYFKIAKLAPAPPPVWVIRSGSAVGAMWGGFVDDILRAPYPSKWDQPGYVPNTEPPLLWQDLRAQYQAELQKAIDKRGFKQAAKVAYETCLGQSIKFQYFDAGSRACEKWLSKHYGKEYHLMDEFRGQSTRINSPLDEQPQALNYDGQAIVVDRREHEEQGG